MEKRVFFEIISDKNNQQGPEAFEHIFVSLHKVFDAHHTKGYKPTFSFEIAKIGQAIRFFISSPEKYAQYIKNQIFAHYKNLEIIQVQDYLANVPNDKIQVGKIAQAKHFLYPIKDFGELQEKGAGEKIDPFASITSALTQSGRYTICAFQVNFYPIEDKMWKKDSQKVIDVLSSHHSPVVKKILLSKYYHIAKVASLPLVGVINAGKWMINPFAGAGHHDDEHSHDIHAEEGEGIKENFLKKISHPGYHVGINLVFAGEDGGEGRIAIKELASTLAVYSLFGNNSLKLTHIGRDQLALFQAKKRIIVQPLVFNSLELSGFVHLPTSYVKTPAIQWLSARSFEPPLNLPTVDLGEDKRPIIDKYITPIGKTNFRGTNTAFGILPDDRRRHIYVIGKTGMGKSTLLENMIIDDMEKGRGLAVIDPHGDLAEGVIGYIPKNRTNHTIIFDPSDKEWPIAFNMLENIDPEHRPLITSGLIGIFKKIFGESWGPRLEHTLRNTIMALLEYPNTTLISIPLMLTSDAYRQKVVAKVTDPVVKKFWTHEFAKLSPSQKTETVNPILNKVGQFLSSPLLRNILGQPKNSFSIRWAMDNGKIIIINLSKGKIGEDASSLLGAMLITKFQLEAMSRADIPEKQRKDFYLYVDEFQNFATDSFATILSEARKYKLNLVMANQYIDQMTDEVRGAVFGNVGSLLSFQVGPSDAKILKEAFGGELEESDLGNLKKYHLYLRELIDGMPSPVFSASTFPPHSRDEHELTQRYEKILQVSREKYCKPRKVVIEKIANMMNEIEKIEEKREKHLEEKKQENKKKK